MFWKLHGFAKLKLVKTDKNLFNKSLVSEGAQKTYLGYVSTTPRREGGMINALSDVQNINPHPPNLARKSEPYP